MRQSDWGQGMYLLNHSQIQVVSDRMSFKRSQIYKHYLSNWDNKKSIKDFTHTRALGKICLLVVFTELCQSIEFLEKFHLKEMFQSHYNNYSFGRSSRMNTELILPARITAIRICSWSE